MRIVLDSDHLRLLQSNSDEGRLLAARLIAAEDDGHEVRITVVALHERLQGWQAAARSARTPVDVARHYSFLLELQQFMSAFDLLPFGPEAVTWLEVLQGRKLGRLNSLDKRLAAIVLASQAGLLLTGDSQFELIEELRGEVHDWRFSPDPNISPPDWFVDDSDART